jgi:hypothetical protein
MGGDGTLGGGLRKRLWRGFLLSVWGMFTLMLLFTVVFLVGEMVKRGQDPVALLRPDAPANTAQTPRPRTTTLGARDTILYFAREDGSGLAPEARRINVTPSTVENCRRALKLLSDGPSRGLMGILPPESTVRALYLLDDGELVIDFASDIQPDSGQERSTTLEAFWIYGVVNTLTQAELRGSDGAEVRRVRFLIDGSPPQENFPAHFDLSSPIGPDMAWVAGSAPAAHG